MTINAYTNREFAKSDKRFKHACKAADIKPTKRQASKMTLLEKDQQTALKIKESWLEELLKELGYKKTLRVYQSVGKWYG